MSEIKNKIQSLKSLRASVSPNPEWLKSNREILVMQISNTLEAKKAATWWRMDSVWNFLKIFLPSRMVGYVVRPVMAVMAIFGLIFGGWTTTVSASYNSLPGDVLYSVKLATESMQTSLASKPEEIKLRMEFAGRRAEEVKKIVKSDVSKIKKEQKVEEAVKHLKNDLEVVRVNLDTIKNDPVTVGSSQVVVDVAKVVDQKSTEIQKSLEQTNTDAAIAAKDAPVVAVVVPVLNNNNVVLVADQVKQAAAVAQETGVKAIEVIVEKHQADNSTVSKEEVKSIVDNKLDAIAQKVTQIEQQVNTFVTTSTPKTENVVLKAAQEKLVEPVKQTTEAAKTTLTEAKDELAKDNLDAAVDKLKQSSVLSQVAEVKVDATKILAVPVEQVVASSTVPAVPSVPGVVTSTGVIAPTAEIKTTIK
ncbi:MAG: hypothetical protein UT86_C0002G0006 [Candidatus Magasanikbacteria bacterium GW2011_GWC2_40_17]|uniref:Uncharacterized protein n=1 Tax=Candidatus Magasanikbacteria bacterium GW2011_GWA2_42_32 TaxID=1619039 RepID=A0A0G1CDR6_9BACT|nr:MAG: hypothetical protein UT86_C0002G0006 [Candidatus Magasanikbacteria bacterium GW2011_GWC2_40_17]KKS56841.1 MAG: hypothetical protein UV20_C0005G0006 [Candidatus Magasanikbacteria bacterium GW2011_GWA2_42_32]OGH86205.1 MAG: hypothetical protein A2294_03340 [Candidatus Magasanikbacteria bacterium RIFOXYB2_FULL_38_10]